MTHYFSTQLLHQTVRQDGAFSHIILGRSVWLLWWWQTRLRPSRPVLLPFRLADRSADAMPVGDPATTPLGVPSSSAVVCTT